jgi:large repetitive protein
LVTLNGSGSTDPDAGDTLNYAWSQTSGPAVTLSDPTAVSPTFTAPTVAAPTDLTFDLTVCDRPAGDPDQLCNTDSVTITVNPVAGNQPPVANAGPDQTVDSGALVQLNGSGSTDPEGQALTYMWTAPAGITLSDPTSATPTFTAPTGPATLTFTLQVCDPEPLCSTDTVTINVNAPAMIDATGVVIVNGPVSTSKTSKSFVFKVTNDGTTAITIDASNITEGSVSVNGTATGTVSVNPFTKTLNPGASTRVKLSWSYPAGSLVAGDTVVFHACVTVTGDIDTTNDCDDQSVTVAR